MMKKDRGLYLICLFLILTTNSSYNQILGYQTQYKFSLENVTTSRDWESLSLIHSDKYHTPEELIQELENINTTAPGIIDLFSIGNSIEGREILCVRITNENNTSRKPGTLIIAQHHAREQITVEMALRFIIHLANGYGMVDAISDLIDTQQIFVIPTLNPDGLHYVLGNKTFPGNPWLRKNARKIDDDGDGFFDEDSPDDLNKDGLISKYEMYVKSGNAWKYAQTYWEGNDTDNDGKTNEDPFGGVDLNRNYPYRWNDSTLDSGWGSDSTLMDYPGTVPFSEPETAALKKFLEERSFATAMSLHSGTNQTYFPWASTGVWINHGLYTSIYTDLRGSLPSNFFSYINDGYSVGYTIAGDWADWMYSEKTCLVPMTFEIYHNKSVDSLEKIVEQTDYHVVYRFEEIFGYFNPIEAYIASLWEDLRSSFEYWLTLTPRLRLTGYSAIGGNLTGESLRISLTIRNLSPRISTIERLSIVDEDYDKVKGFMGSDINFAALDGFSTQELTFQILLKEDLPPDRNLTFRIGNRFVGYSTFIVLGEKVIISTSTSFGDIWACILLPIAILIKRKLRPKELRNSNS
ncbi:MAG: M14 family zinc carboxypeptidase [Candidatus Heimdallarchaeota archaeon]